MVLLGGLEFIAAGYILAEATKGKRERKRQEEAEEQRRYEHAQRRRRHSDQGMNRPHQPPHHQPSYPPPSYPPHRRSSPDKHSKERRHDRKDSSKPSSGKGDSLLPPPILKNSQRPGSAPPPGTYLPNPQGQWQPQQAPARYDDPSRYVPAYHYPPPPALPMSPVPQQSYPNYNAPQPPSYSQTSQPHPMPPTMAPSHYIPPPHGVWEMPAGSVTTHLHQVQPGRDTRPFSPHVHFADQVQSNSGRLTPPPPYREV